MSASQQVYLRCRIGRDWYGINTDNVLKVLQMVALTELPYSSPDVLGLLTLPNGVIPVIDLRRRLGLPDAPLRLDNQIIVVDTSSGTIGLIVDEADDIEMIAEAQIERFTTEVSPHILGTVRYPDHLLLLLDTSKLVVEAQSDV